MCRRRGNVMMMHCVKNLTVGVCSLLWRPECSPCLHVIRDGRGRSGQLCIWIETETTDGREDSGRTSRSWFIPMLSLTPSRAACVGTTICQFRRWFTMTSKWSDTGIDCTDLKIMPAFVGASVPAWTYVVAVRWFVGLVGGISGLGQEAVRIPAA